MLLSLPEPTNGTNRRMRPCKQEPRVITGAVRCGSRPVVLLKRFDDRPVSSAAIGTM